MRLLILALASLATWASTAEARVVPAWPYDKLLADADLVVIGRAVSSADTGETLPDNSWGKLLGVETSFQPQAVLKGKLAGNKLTVLHYRLEGKLMPPNGPMLVSFRRAADKTKGGPDYLLFLKRRADGRYEPVTGQIDPAFSVREMSWPRGH
jgi:hypothetical protein